MPGLWRRRFNSDPAIAGKAVNLSGHIFTVVGVAPTAFHSIDQILDPEFWVPLGTVSQLVPGLENQNRRDFHWLAVIARLRPGVTRVQASAELKTLAQSFARAYPETDKGGGFVFEQAGSLPPRDRGTVLMFLAALAVVVLLVLVIAGANVANLLFAQAAARQRDMAVRLALGATRGRLQRQILMESVLLGLGGGVLGVLLSLWATRGLSAFHLPAPVPLNVQVGIDWRVLLYSFALSVLSGLLLGLAPAWAAARPLLTNALKGEDALSRPGRRISLRNLLVVAQISMSLVLVCVTGLFLRSLQNAAAIDIGFRSQNLLLMSVDPRIHGYTPERTVAFLTQLRNRVAALPGVESAVATDTVPLSGGGRSDGIAVPGQKNANKAYITAELYMVTPGYFQTIGTPLLAGRDFGGESPTAPKKAIVNRALVDQRLRRRKSDRPASQRRLRRPTKSSAWPETSKRARSERSPARCSTARCNRASPVIPPSWATPSSCAPREIRPHSMKRFENRFMPSTPPWPSSTKRQWRSMFAAPSSCLAWPPPSSASSDALAWCLPRSASMAS